MDEQQLEHWIEIGEAWVNKLTGEIITGNPQQCLEECGVCYRDKTPMHFVACSTCKNKICTSCIYQIQVKHWNQFVQALNDMSLNFMELLACEAIVLYKHGDYLCPFCRQKCNTDF